jgi:hypothetical protein
MEGMLAWRDPGEGDVHQHAVLGSGQRHLADLFAVFVFEGGSGGTGGKGRRGGKGKN